MKRLIPALALLLASGPAFAQTQTQTQTQTQAQAQTQAPVDHVRSVGELAAVCDPITAGVPRLEAIAYCQGFLTSFGQHHALMNPPGHRGRALFCVPNPGPSIAQSGIAFARWARENPARAGEPALDGLLRWAQASFPCTTPDARAPRAAR